MTMPNESAPLGVQTLDFTKEEVIAAPIEITWQATLAELGPEGQMPDGTSLKLKIEPWPGGRWYRDLGDNAGHFWGHVQVIKPPKLLEIFGPCFISYPATQHIQYRFTEAGDGKTRLKVTNRAFGYMPKDFLDGMDEGWEYGFKRIAEIAERMKKGKKR